MKPRFGSLFAGVGGFDLGLERAGWECAWQVEIDPFCRRVLTRHWPEVPRFTDIREVRGAELPPVDIICGGWPCQDVSVAGKRAGLAGARSGLFHEMTRIVKEMRDATGNTRPTFVMGENVPGLLSSNGGRDFAAVLHGLAQCGAVDVGWRILDSRFFGVPQRRRRVFFAADFGAERAGQVLAFGESVLGHSQESGEAGEEPADGTGAGVAHSLRVPSRGAAYKADSQDDFVIEPAHALTARGRKGGDPTTDNYIPFDTTQITSDKNYSNPRPGDVCHPLAEGAHPPAIALASHEVSPPLMAEGFDASEDGSGRKAFAFAWQQGDDSPHTGTGRGRSWVARAGDDAAGLSTTRYDAVAFSGKDSGQDAGALAPTLRAMGHDRSHANGGGQLAVAFNHIQDPVSSPSVGATLGEDGQAVVLTGRPVDEPCTLDGFIGILTSYADAAEAGPDQVLRLVRAAARTQADAERCAGVLARFWAPEVLRPEVHGAGVRREGEHVGRLERNAPARPETGAGGAVQPLREASGEGCPPPGPRPPEQRSGEPGAPLPLLPQPGASVAAALHRLRTTPEGARVLQQALHSLEEVRRPAGDSDPAEEELLVVRGAGAQPGTVREALHDGEAGGGTPTAQVRRLSPTECERLMSLPDGWTCLCGAEPYSTASCTCADGPRYAACGNAVVANVVTWLGARLLGVMSVNSA